MRLIPGPADVLSAASTLSQGAGRAVEDVADLFALVGRAGELMTRAEALVTAAEATLVRAELLLDDAEVQLDASAAALESAQATAETGRRLTAELEHLAAAALPKAQAVVDSIEPDEIRAVKRLVDHLPELVSRLETSLLPTLEQLDNVGPDVHRILDSVTDLSHAIAGLPGVGLLQRRGERRENEDDHEGDEREGGATAATAG